MFHIKTMSAEDFEFAAHITEQMKWNLAEADFQFMLELEPRGSFVLLNGSEKVGIATTVSFGRIGWFGNLIVSEPYRKKGAGSLLVKHSIKYLTNRGVKTVGLYAYRDKMPFYTRLGFSDDSNFSVLKGKGLSSPTKTYIKPINKQEMQQVVDYDEACFGASRKKMLEPILLDTDNLCYMAVEDGQICGYVAAKVYKGMAEVGPLVCQQGHVGIAVDLLKTILSRLQGLETSMFVPENEPSITGMLKKAGFHEGFRVAQMFYGIPLAKECIYLAESLERG